MEKKGLELPEWGGKFPKRYGCQYPRRKCKDCYHTNPCVPDYNDECRMKDEELTSGGIAFIILFWICIIVILTTFI